MFSAHPLFKNCSGSTRTGRGNTEQNLVSAPWKLKSGRLDFTLYRYRSIKYGILVIIVCLFRNKLFDDCYLNEYERIL